MGWISFSWQIGEITPYSVVVHNSLYENYTYNYSPVDWELNLVPPIYKERDSIHCAVIVFIKGKK